MVDRSQTETGRLDFFFVQKQIALIRDIGTVPKRCLEKLKVISLLKDASNRF